MSRKRYGISFDPERVAHYEKAGWQAYYDRNWPKAFWLLVRGNRELFHMSWLRALSAALDTVRASIAFAPLENNDVPRAQRLMEKFYQKARSSANIAADAPTLARLEMDYWVVHRRLAIERKGQPDVDNREPMVQSLAALHRALFGGSREAMRRSAEQRAAAAVAVDRITGGYSSDIAADWREVERCLGEAYRFIRDDAGGTGHEHDA
jgi:hypothetical protein